MGEKNQLESVTMTAIREVKEATESEQDFLG